MAMGLPWHMRLVGVQGVEPRPADYQSAALPLSYTPGRGGTRGGTRTPSAGQFECRVFASFTTRAPFSVRTSRFQGWRARQDSNLYPRFWRPMFLPVELQAPRLQRLCVLEALPGFEPGIPGSKPGAFDRLAIGLWMEAASAEGVVRPPGRIGTASGACHRTASVNGSGSCPYTPQII